MEVRPCIAALGIKEGLVECVTVCFKSEVILMYMILKKIESEMISDFKSNYKWKNLITYE